MFFVTMFEMPNDHLNQRNIIFTGGVIVVPGLDVVAGASPQSVGSLLHHN